MLEGSLSTLLRSEFKLKGDKKFADLKYRHALTSGKVGGYPHLWAELQPSKFTGVPWTARRSNQSILKEINPEYSLEGLMLQLQYFGHLMEITDLLEKTLL